MKSNTRKKSQREAKAIHLYFAKGWTQEEIADEMDIAVSTVSNYVNSEPSEEVKRLMDEQAAKVRVNILEQLKEQLQTVNTRKEEATTVSAVYDTGDGEVEVNEVPTDGGGTKLVPKVQDYELRPDWNERSQLRHEERNILDQMGRLVGANDPEEHKIEHEGSGIQIVLDESDEE